ncbi:hypothetical protein HDU92_007724 [Lobulomyces angularis]|nr:hypothetical protein HDU92_007724 [Lobulomyces angularis]
MSLPYPPSLEEAEGSVNNSANEIHLNSVLSDRRQSAIIGNTHTIKNNANTTSKPELIRLQLIPWSTVPMIKPILNELVERRVREGQSFKVGRQVQKEGMPLPTEPPNPLDVWFSSKVVSRSHAEFSIKDGLIWIRDVGSSSGTFLNKNRLSPTTKESKPFQVKEGDIIQFGVDYKGKPDESEQSTDDQTAECCICFDETGPFQALFLAPCCHCYHYKCVASIIVQSAMFQCPLCRQVANLTASVSMENLNSAIDENVVAIGAKGDPNRKYSSAPPPNNAAVETGNPVVNEISPKKRRSSFTARISTFLGRRSSTSASDSTSPSPNGNPSATPQSNSNSPVLRNSVSAHPFQPVSESNENNNINAGEDQLAEEADIEPVIENNDNAPHYVVSSVEGNLFAQLPPEISNSNIPRSITVNTFEENNDINVGNEVQVVNIPGTINEV